MTRPPGLSQTLVVEAPPAAVFEALSTLDGLARWWTPAVTGDPGPGGELTFGFGDQRIVVRVDHAEPGRQVSWTCVRHTKFPEWEGTRVRFALEPTGADRSATELAFEHAGLVADLPCYPDCSAGWGHYLGSLAAVASGEEGMPWRSTSWRPART